MYIPGADSSIYRICCLLFFFVCLPLWDLILNSEEAYLLSIVISHEKLKL